MSSETELNVSDYANAMVLGIDYQFHVPENDAQAVHIEFLKGKYTGTTIKYGKIKFEEKEDAGHLQFAFDVIKSENTKPKKLQKDQIVQTKLEMIKSKQKNASLVFKSKF